MGYVSLIKKIDNERNLQNRVYEVIKDYLIHTSIPSGTRLYEEELAKEIGVSRTPVRIALNRLGQEGLVKISPNRGTFKVHLSLREVVEIIRIREALECLSLEMTYRIDEELIESLSKLVPDVSLFENRENMAKYPEFDQKFHELLVQAGKSQWLFGIIKTQDSLLHMLRLLSLQNIERIRSSIEEHGKIVEALKMKNISLVIDCTRENYRSAIKSMEQKNMEVPGLFL